MTPKRRRGDRTTLLVYIKSTSGPQPIWSTAHLLFITLLAGTKQFASPPVFYFTFSSVMFSSFTAPLSLNLFRWRNKTTFIDIPSVEIHDVETATEKRARRLKHLLKLNHANHAILFHDLHFHNHMPHVRRLPILWDVGSCAKWCVSSWAPPISWVELQTT